jgi:hypothetical protein
MPIQIWVNPFWCQLIADTLPEMAFASAWTLLVSFFVELVGVASGSYPTMSSSSGYSSSFGGTFGNALAYGLSTTPGIVVMQWTAYVVYIMLVATYLFWATVASAVLLYALLCCIYAALFGTSLYFGPRLFTLLQPSMARHSGLTIRLGLLTVLTIWVFGAQTYGMARRVVAPPNRGISWWWQYGILELIPAALCLLMIKHRTVNNGNVSTSAGDDVTAIAAPTSAASLTNNAPKPSATGGGMSRRSDSHGSVNRAASTGHRIPGTNHTTNSVGSGGGGSESAPLLKPSMAYGSTATGGSETNITA